jgi:hypothetical protein
MNAFKYPTDPTQKKEKPGRRRSNPGKSGQPAKRTHLWFDNTLGPCACASGDRAADRASGQESKGVEVSASTRRFGPFVNVPCEGVQLAGWRCQRCRKQVERFAQAIPGMVPRMIFCACKWGTIVVWEDESQPCSASWPLATRLMKSAAYRS